MEPLAAEPVDVVQSPEQRMPEVVSPDLELPGPSAPEPTAVVPEAWDPRMPRVEPRSAEDVPELGDEVVGRRDALTEVFANADGTETVKVHSVPVHYQPDGSSAWEMIDNTLVADDTRPGWVRNAGNDWTVRFGPIVPGGAGGLELVNDAGVVRAAPELDAGSGAVFPVVGEGDDADKVMYEDVWPGVDVVYTVSNAAVKEDIIVHEGARAEYPFVVEGLGLVESTPSPSRGASIVDVAVAPGDDAEDADLGQIEVAPAPVPAMPDVSGVQADHVDFGPLLVTDSDAVPTGDAGVSARVEPFVAPPASGSGGATAPDAEAAEIEAEVPTAADPVVENVAPVTSDAQRLVVSVDESWLDDQADGEHPVIVDPTLVTVGATRLCQFGVDGVDGSCDAIGTGTYVPNIHWWRRGVAQWPYQGHVQSNDVLYAGIWMNEAPGSTPDPEVVNIWEATSWTAAGAVNNGDPNYWIDSQVVQDGGCGVLADVCFDVTDKMHQWQLRGVFNGWWDGKFGFAPDEGDYNGNGSPDISEYYSFKQFNLASGAILVMNLNARTPAPTLTAPADGALAVATLAPSFSWQAVSDPDGDPVTYTVKIGTGTDGESGLVAISPALTTTSWTPPAGVLQDGVTYHWKVFASDSKSTTPSAVRKLTVDRRQGLGGLSPDDDFGVVSTNLVTGAPNLHVTAPEMPTVGGGIGVDFTYNGRPALTGLVGTYREDKDKDHVIDSDDEIKLVRTDNQISFAWGSGTPSPAVPADGFQVSWRGTVQMPAGNWQFGVRSDDGARIWIDDTKVLDRWSELTPTTVFQTGSTSGQHELQIDYYEHSGPAYLELWARPAGGGAAFIVPADWLSPETSDMPVGWSLQAADMSAYYTRAFVSEASIALTGVDGESYSFTKLPNGTYRAPTGVEDVVSLNANGTVSVHDDAGFTYSFRADGGLSSIRSALDDRYPAAAVNHFDDRGRLEEITDPVSGRKVTLRYATADGDSACPGVPPLGSSSEFEAEEGMLCQVSYWDGTNTDLYYFKATDLLSHIVNPGDQWWSFSYDAQARLVAAADPMARDVLWAGARTDTDLNRLFTQVAYMAPVPNEVSSRVATVTAPAALQTDTLRPQRIYSYAPTVTGGVLAGGTATVARAGDPGPDPYRSVTYDYRGRSTAETNATGQTTRTTWDIRDLEVATETADGLMTATSYNGRNQPVDVWGPAPKDQFHWVQYGTSAYPFPKPEYVAQIPHAVTRYDEGITGLQTRWWGSTTIAGAPKAHANDPGQLRDDNAARPTGVPADAASARYTGDITYPATGEYKMQLCVGAQDAAWLYVDGRLVTSVWGVSAAACSDNTQLAAIVRTLGNSETHRIQVDYVDFGGADRLHLNWTTPSGTYQPAGGLTAGYGLATSTVDPDGKTTATSYTDAATGVGPQHGLVTSTTLDPGAASHLNLTETTTYESVGTGYLRRRTRTLPGGPETATTNSWYKGKDEPGDPVNETADDPCTSGTELVNQGGLLRRDTAADPDGTGPQTPLVRENVYDVSGRVVANRTGSDDWTCTSYDSRGRVTEIAYPAYGGEPARTVTNDYSADPDGSGPRTDSPLVTTVTDPAGTVMVENDLLARPIRYVDVWGNTTTFTYDQAGREITNQGPAGVIAKTYNASDQVTTLSRNNQILAVPTYEPVTGRLASVTYPAGAGNAGNGTAGEFTYDTNRGELASVTWRDPNGAVITTDQITARSKGGDIISQTIDGGTHSYSYDTAGRLTEAVQPGRTTQYSFAAPSCGYAGSGRNTNRTSQTIVGGDTTTYCYDPADRLTSASDPTVGTIAYDSHGNTAEIFGETHTYDAADRHLTTTKDDTTVSYVRDATDRIVERKVDGVTTARYGSTGSGDAPDFTQDTAGNVLEVTYGLPGGALLTTRVDGNVWSYPNTHGDITVVANQAGVQQGPTRLYDPYGNPIVGETPDNSVGNFDYGWLGQHQRPTEHQLDFQPVIEMGARQYSPMLGRFLEVDPVEGGSANDYDYTNADPVNMTDLDGEWPRIRCGWCSRARRAVSRAARNPWVQGIGVLAACSTGIGCGLAVYGTVALNAYDRGRRHGFRSRAFLRGTAIDLALARLPIRSPRGVRGALVRSRNPIVRANLGRVTRSTYRWMWRRNLAYTGVSIGRSYTSW